MSETQAVQRMTRAQRDMAIAIAHDVILQLRRTDGSAMEVVSASGYIDGELPEDETPFAYSDDLSSYVDLIQANCEVCMLGACLLSKARLFDAVPISAFVGRDGDGAYIYGHRYTVTEHLRSVFDDETMFELEDAFEEGRGGNDEGRAIAIMENLVRNDGIFSRSEFDDEFKDEFDDEDDEEWDDDEDDDLDDEEDEDEDEDEDEE